MLSLLVALVLSAIADPIPPKATTAPKTIASSVVVHSTAEAQNAFDTLPAGSTIQLDSAVQFGPLVIPDGKSGLSISPTGTNTTINSGAPTPCLTIGLRCTDLTLRGLIFQSSNAGTTSEVFTLVTLGYDQTGQREAATVDELPNRVLFQQCKFLGTPTGSTRIGLLGNAVNLTVNACEFREIHVTGIEAQGILVTNTPGPGQITGCTIEAAGENIMLGGSKPTIPDCQIADFRITGNTLSKPISWKGKWAVKNHFEIKNGVRILFDSNKLWNNWLANQDGTSILLTPRNGKVGDVKISNNTIDNVGSGCLLSAGNDADPAAPASGPMLFDSNQWTRVSALEGSGRVYDVACNDARQIQSLVIRNEKWQIDTAFGKSIMFIEGPAGKKPCKYFEMRNCCGNYAKYGIIGTGSSPGTSTFDAWLSPYTLLGNVFWTTSPIVDPYPAGISVQAP